MHIEYSQPAAGFLLKMSEGHFGTGSLLLPSSETAYGQEQRGSAEILQAGEAACGGCCDISVG